MAEGLTKLADQIPSEDCYSLKDLSAELGVGAQMARKVINRALKARVVQNLTKKEGAKILYAPQMVEPLVQAYKEGKLGKVRTGTKLSQSALNKAALVITVPVFDREKANIIKSQFSNDQEIVRFIQDKLDEVANPALSDLKKLEAEFEQKKQAILIRRR